ncbi:hypothetical protein [Polycladomyces subterraneus]|uniref:Uncharacterized protein n=1 Tax=Polycladomyces subterraneus TaxID=1016997 RepID=A0ABT8IQB4_9BACL|nr:hypothetical protein [Polycladomyces subterraneus]MDN4594299.1 hypothetical protein [Polycladomyces subterraneus]
MKGEGEVKGSGDVPMNKRDWLVIFCGSAMFVLIIAGIFLLAIGLVPALDLYKQTLAGGMKGAPMGMVQLLWDSPGRVIWQIGALHVVTGGVGLWWVRRVLGGDRKQDRDQLM